MNRLFGAVAAVAVLSFVGLANAAEIRGIIKSTTDRTITVETTQAGQPNAPAGIAGNTVEITIPPPAAGQTDMRIGLVPGMTVTVTYTTAGNVNTASKIVK